MDYKSKSTINKSGDKVTWHLNRQILPLAHTPMYNWHKFWSSKTWNVVAEFIKTYCPEDGVVFDPFSGSGVTGLEALKSNWILSLSRNDVLTLKDVETSGRYLEKRSRK